MAQSALGIRGDESTDHSFHVARRVVDDERRLGPALEGKVCKTAQSVETTRFRHATGAQRGRHRRSIHVFNNGSEQRISAAGVNSYPEVIGGLFAPWIEYRVGRFPLYL